MWETECFFLTRGKVRCFVADGDAAAQHPLVRRSSSVFASQTVRRDSLQAMVQSVGQRRGSFRRPSLEPATEHKASPNSPPGGRTRISRLSAPEEFSDHRRPSMMAENRRQSTSMMPIAEGTSQRASFSAGTTPAGAFDSNEARKSFGRSESSAGRDESIYTGKVLSTGGYFGEIGLLTANSRRTANVIALSFCELHFLMADDFEAMARSSEGQQFLTIMCAVARSRLPNDNTAQQSTQSLMPASRRVSSNPFSFAFAGSQNAGRASADDDEDEEDEDWDQDGFEDGSDEDADGAAGHGGNDDGDGADNKSEPTPTFADSTEGDESAKKPPGLKKAGSARPASRLSSSIMPWQQPTNADVVQSTPSLMQEMSSLINGEHQSIAAASPVSIRRTSANNDESSATSGLTLRPSARPGVLRQATRLSSRRSSSEESSSGAHSARNLRTRWSEENAPTITLQRSAQANEEAPPLTAGGELLRRASQALPTGQSQQRAALVHRASMNNISSSQQSSAMGPGPPSANSSLF